MRWSLGYPQQALNKVLEAVNVAQTYGQPVSEACAHCLGAIVHLNRNEASVSEEHANAAIVLSTDYGLPQWLALGEILHGGALIAQGRIDKGMEQAGAAFDGWQSTGTKLWQSLIQSFLAKGCGKRKEFEKAHAHIDEALAYIANSHERFHEAELHRLKGELLLQQSEDNHSEAEGCYQKSLRVSRKQEAKSWELRAATSLARLWQQQGKTAEARELLAPVYNWFTEGFDTADLKDAKALLEVLS